MGGRFGDGLPQVSDEDNKKLEAPLTLAELGSAVGSLKPGRVPGIDGLSADFYKAFWDVLGPDLLEVFTYSLESSRLPLSCRRAVLTLLPKKGDLQLLKNWRPVSLLCMDYKILSKVLASRLRGVMASVIHVDQTYCVPSRLIGDNITLIRDVLEVSGSLGINLGLISIDQEKAFDRVEHQYLWQTMTAFGFSPGFIAHIRTLYCDVMSVLKVNGGLSAPFSVGRGIRQGCSLSGMLYSLSIEPLLHRLRADLQGVLLPGARPFKVSAYADDLIVFVNSQRDVEVLADTVQVFGQVSSSRGEQGCGGGLSLLWGEGDSVHCFWECGRLRHMLELLRGLFTSLGAEFNAQVFVGGVRYSNRSRRRGRLLSFLVGQAKMAVYVSRRRMVQDQSEISPRALLVRMVQARLRLEFGLYRINGDQEGFEER
uniref:Reverse transcriptase domain-containing protein n=1 Tax=Knipowitschia caucasica TaxID=637954 RepID=A0AAV2MGX3_KNICA